MTLFHVFKKKNQLKEYQDSDIVACVNGKLISASEIKDPIFSEELMGQTIGIEPYDGHIVCPVNGTVNAIFPTKHAFGIMSNEGIGILVHIGVDTVSLNGEGFKAYIKQGQKVKAGQKAVDVDLSFIEKKGLLATTMMVVTDKPYEDFKLNITNHRIVNTSEIINE